MQAWGKSQESSFSTSCPGESDDAVLSALLLENKSNSNHKRVIRGNFSALDLKSKDLH